MGNRDGNGVFLVRLIKRETFWFVDTDDRGARTLLKIKDPALSARVSGHIAVTVKMVGSPAEVEAQRDNFLGYCQSLAFFNVAPAKEGDRYPKPEKE